jgi:hypothetical protein
VVPEITQRWKDMTFHLYECLADDLETWEG